MHVLRLTPPKKGKKTLRSKILYENIICFNIQTTERTSIRHLIASYSMWPH